VTTLAATSGEAKTKSFDRVSRAVHWLAAALTVVVVSLGWAIAGAPRNTPTRDLLLLLHRSVGLTVFAMMLSRVAWRWSHPAPPLPLSVTRFERALAGSTHALLYLLLIAMPVSGYLNAAAAGHSVSFFGIVSIPSPIPEDNRLSQLAIAVHVVGQYLLYFLVALHVAGALRHGFVKRDGVIERVLPVRRATPRRSWRSET
jgi:cytochrome b561